MSYGTVSQFKSRYPLPLLKSLTDDIYGETISDDVIQQALDRACLTLNQYISTQYDVPLSPVPDIVIIWEQELAFFELYQRWKDDDRVVKIHDYYFSEQPKGILPQLRDGDLLIYGADASLRKKAKYAKAYKTISIPTPTMSIIEYDSTWKEKE